MYSATRHVRVAGVGQALKRIGSTDCDSQLVIDCVSLSSLQPSLSLPSGPLGSCARSDDQGESAIERSHRLGWNREEYENVTD
eukprot:COSAG02_NODE_29_length_51136_cov_346.293317_27_plen_83_part_00